MIGNITFNNRQNFRYPAYAASGRSIKSAGSSRFIVQAIQSNNNLNGKHVTLNMGCLVSMAAGNGQELHMKYDESSTEENPVIRAWGKDSQGKAFEQKIYVNDIDPENASPAEMKALQAHLSAQGDRAAAGHGSIPLDASMSGFDVNQKIDFTQYFEEWIAMQEIANKQNAASYRLELESYLFFCRQNNLASGAVNTDQYTESTSSVKAESSPELKDEDYEYLSGKWNPTQMSQDEYDEFLDYLHNKGIVSEEDKKYVGYGGEVCDDFECVSYYTPYENPVIDFSDGNLLAFTRCQSSYTIFDSNGMESETGKYIVNLYKTITGILEEMQMRRENQ